MSSFYLYISQFIPIFAGMGIMLLLRSIEIRRNSIRIETQKREDLQQGDAVGIQVMPGGDAPDLLRYSFEREVNEMLIVSGLLPGGKGNRNIARLAFLELGAVELSDLRMLHANKTKSGMIRVFVNNEGEFYDRICTFGVSSGMLIAYLADCRIELISR